MIKLERTKIALTSLCFLIFQNSYANTVSAKPISPPTPNEVCFSPDEPCDAKLIKFIQSAKKTIDVAAFDITHDQIAHEIMVQSKKIKVRVLVDTRQSHNQYSSISTIIKAGTLVRYGRQRGLMHNKFIIVDGKMIETGSFNYTDGAAFKNNENQIYLSTPLVVNRYIKRFEKLWQEGKNNTLKVENVL